MRLDELTRDWDTPDNWYSRNRWEDFGASYRKPHQEIFIVGMPGVGKKTLCNSLWGWKVIHEVDTAAHNFGMISLINLPAQANEDRSIMYRLEYASLILYVIDASKPLHAEDFTWIARLKALNTPLLITANKMDILEKALQHQMVSELEEKLARPVLPLIASDSGHVHRHFLPMLLKHYPNLAEPLGAEIAGLRRRIASRLILQTSITSAMVSANNGGLNDTTALLSVQIGLLKRIATLYAMASRGTQRIELGLAAILRVCLQAMDKLAARYPQIQVRMLNGAVASVSTFIVGWLMVLYCSRDTHSFINRFAFRRRKPTHVDTSA